MPEERERPDGVQEPAARTDVAPDLSVMIGEVAARARDAAYIAVGLGILGVQRAQAARRRLAGNPAQVEERLVRLGTDLAVGAQQFGEWLEGTAELVGSSLQPLEEQLPEAAREVAGKARAQLQAWGAQLLQAGRPGA